MNFRYYSSYKFQLPPTRVTGGVIAIASLYYLNKKVIVLSQTTTFLKNSQSQI